MEKGYVENGFIVDLAHSTRLSEVIYGLSKILDMPEAKNKNICIKLGDINLSEQELVSIKALVENMDSKIEFISTNSEITAASAQDLGISISEVSANIPALNINDTNEQNVAVNHEIATALDKIFGDDYTDDFKPDNTQADFEGFVSAEVTDESSISSDDIEVVSFDESTLNEDISTYAREAEKLPTLYINRTLRSGQSISSDGNIVIIGDVNPGAEVIAKGDITVWGILGGIAHAGSDGNTYSRIRALKLNAIQIRIGNIYARRPDTVNTPYIHRTDSYIPEEARVTKNHILIYKLREA